jgi:hypothetical protein
MREKGHITVRVYLIMDVGGVPPLILSLPPLLLTLPPLQPTLWRVGADVPFGEVDRLMAVVATECVNPRP